MDKIVSSVLIGSSSDLQLMRTGIKSWTSSISGLIRLFASELHALGHLNFFHRFIMEKMLWIQ